MKRILLATSLLLASAVSHASEFTDRQNVVAHLDTLHYSVKECIFEIKTFGKMGVSYPSCVQFDETMRKSHLLDVAKALVEHNAHTETRKQRVFEVRDNIIVLQELLDNLK